MEIYERIVKVVSAIIAICCVSFLWGVSGSYEAAQRYPVKEIEWQSLENYALETAKNLNEEDANISKEEIARRKKDNYKVVEKRYSNDKFFVKVESDIAEVEASIPASVIEKSRDGNIVDFKMNLKYSEATYTREATIYPKIVYIGMLAFMTAFVAIILYYILYFIGAGVAGIILLIKLIVQKIKK